MPKLDPFVKVWFVFGLFIGISAPCGLFNTEIRLIYKGLITIMTTYIFNFPL